jgi:WWE domain
VIHVCSHWGVSLSVLALAQYLENMEDYETIADAMVAVAAVAPPKKWWFSLSGAWLPHDEDTCQRLDAAAASGIERFEITIGGELYVVDLKRGTQKRLDRGIESSLRHGNGHFVDGAGAQLVRAATVQKQNADGAPGRPHAFPALAGGAKRNVKRRR